MGLLVFVAGLLLVAAGAFLAWRSFPAAPAPAGDLPRVLENSGQPPLPAFRLDGPRGAFGNESLLGRWSFMFFGYTQCPDVCPTTLGVMQQIRAVLPAPTFQVVFVSVDSRRDSRELLDAYLGAFAADFIGLRGDDAALAPLVSTLGIQYRRDDADGKPNYTVDHTASIHLIDPRGRPAAVFPPPHDARSIAAEFRRIAAGQGHGDQRARANSNPDLGISPAT